MKTPQILLILVLAFAGSVLADDKKPDLPPLPQNVTLQNGAILRNISVIRWEKDRVVLKHAGGADPVPFNIMSSADRAVFEANKEAGLARTSADKAIKTAKAENENNAYVASLDHKKRIADAINRHVLIVGMTEGEATESWGTPDKINSTGGAYGATAQWIYMKTPRDFMLSAKYIRDHDTYVYFHEGMLTSWQD